jgi:ATP-dependent DNA ligase
MRRQPLASPIAGKLALLTMHRGAVVFRAACTMGQEGIVAKRRDSRYCSGRCRDWVKIKNIAHPAIERAMLIALSKGQRQG